MPDNEELENFKPLESREKVHIANISISISYKQKKGMEMQKPSIKKIMLKKIEVEKKLKQLQNEN